MLCWYITSPTLSLSPAPSYFSLIYNLVKHFVDEKTAEKVILCGGRHTNPLTSMHPPHAVIIINYHVNGVVALKIAFRLHVPASLVSHACHCLCPGYHCSSHTGPLHSSSKSTTPSSYYSNISKYSTLYVVPFP